MLLHALLLPHQMLMHTLFLLQQMLPHALLLPHQMLMHTLFLLHQMLLHALLLLYQILLHALLLLHQMLLHTLDQLRNPRVFHLHADRIDDDTGGYGADHLQYAQAVFPQSAAGLHDIDNHFCQSDNRRQFDRAIQPDQLYSLIFLIATDH